jgi:hypothetical protein
MSSDYLEDDENVKAMRETAQQIGLVALLRDVRREHLKTLERLDADRARITKALMLLGVADKERS